MRQMPVATPKNRSIDIESLRRTVEQPRSKTSVATVKPEFHVILDDRKCAGDEDHFARRTCAR